MCHTHFYFLYPHSHISLKSFIYIKPYCYVNCSKFSQSVLNLERALSYFFSPSWFGFVLPRQNHLQETLNCGFLMYLEYWRSFFVVVIFKRLAFRQRVTLAAPLRSWMVRRTFQRQWLKNTLFYFSRCAKFRTQLPPEVRPKLPKWHTFREVTLNICYFYHQLSSPPLVFVLFSFFSPSLFFLFSNRRAINDTVLFLIYKICWVDY